MMLVTTKKGDKGKTSLFSKTGVSKHDPRIALIGENDEVQSLIGLLKIHLNHVSTRLFLTTIQEHMYQIMGELSGAQKIPNSTIASWTKNIEQKEKEIMKKTAIGNKFVIPGENEADAWCQYARAAVRRLERKYSAFCEIDASTLRFIPFFNRLSDYLFVLGRSFI